MDFNIWGEQTDPLLFSWQDLLETSTSNDDDDDDDVVMRVVETDREIHHDPLASYRAPIDTLDLVSMNGSDAANFEEFMAMCEKPSERAAKSDYNHDE